MLQTDSSGKGRAGLMSTPACDITDASGGLTIASDFWGASYVGG